MKVRQHILDALRDGHRSIEAAQIAKEMAAQRQQAAMGHAGDDGHDQLFDDDDEAEQALDGHMARGGMRRMNEGGIPRSGMRGYLVNKRMASGGELGTGMPPHQNVMGKNKMGSVGRMAFGGVQIGDDGEGLDSEDGRPVRGMAYDADPGAEESPVHDYPFDSGAKMMSKGGVSMMRRGGSRMASGGQRVSMMGRGGMFGKK